MPAGPPSTQQPPAAVSCARSGGGGVAGGGLALSGCYSSTQPPSSAHAWGVTPAPGKHLQANGAFWLFALRGHLLVADYLPSTETIIKLGQV